MEVSVLEYAYSQYWKLIKPLISVETPLFASEGQSHSGPVEMVLSRIDSMARRWKNDVDKQRNTVFKRREALQ